MSDNIKSFKWSKWGFWLAILAIPITWYITDKYEKSPELLFEIVSNEELLMIKEELPELGVTYRNINLRESKQNISIVTLRLINEGNESVLLNHYDKDYPLGIVIENGKILSMPVITKSSDSTYFKSAIKSIENDTIVFRNQIFNPNSFLTLKILILNKSSIKPKFKSIGKVAKNKNIIVKESPIFKLKERTIWDNFITFGFGVFLVLVINFANVLINRYRVGSKEELLVIQIAELKRRIEQDK